MQTILSNLSIRTRLVVLIIFMIACMTAVLLYVFPSYMGDRAEHGLKRRAEVTALVLSDAFGAYVELDDTTGAQGLLDRIGQTQEIDFAAVCKMTVEGGEEQLASEYFATWMPNLLPTNELPIPGSKPVVQRVDGHFLAASRIHSIREGKPGGIDQPEGQDAAETVGVLFVGFSLAGLSTQRAKIRNTTVLVSIGLLVFGALAAFGIGTIIVRPIRELTTVTANIVSAGDLTQTIDVHSNDEVGQLAASFRSMVDKLRAIPTSLRTLADSVTAVTETASETTVRVSQGASTAQKQVAEAASAMHQMTATLSNIANNVRTLHDNAKQSNKANEGMVLATQHINERVVTLATSADGANRAVERMTAAIKQIAQRIGELDTSVEGTVSAMTEMHSSIQNVERTAIDTNKLSQRVAESAGTGVTVLERTLDGIDKIMKSSTAVSAAIESLGARIQNIGSILEVILEVATQTKMLALNAAIVAAQAGEHGRGFGILADQIKSLAARTNASASEIADLITGIQSESENALATIRGGFAYVEEGVRLGNETARVLREIESSANSASAMVQHITDATVEQSRAAKRVLASVDTIVSTVQEVGHAADEHARGSEQIVFATKQMKISTEAMRQASADQTNATRGIAGSVTNIHQMVVQLDHAQSEQTGAANHTLETVEAIKAIANDQLHAVVELEEAITRLRDHSDQLRQTISEFRV